MLNTVLLMIKRQRDWVVIMKEENTIIKDSMDQTNESDKFEVKD